METLHVITACSRPYLISDIAKAFDLREKNLRYAVRWHIAFQHPKQIDNHGTVKMNEMIELIPADDWVWILDDDNLVHPQFFDMLNCVFEVYANHKKAFVFSQNRADVLGPVLKADPDNMRVGRVDTAQVVFKKSLLGPVRLPDSHVADGIFYEELFKIHGEEAFKFLSDPVVNFNGCRKL